MGLNLEHHIPEFTAQNIDGELLLQLESSELKVSYIYMLHVIKRPMRGLCQVTFLLKIARDQYLFFFTQVLGVTSSQDRALIKKKIKDLKVMMEKAKKNREKVEKQREKLQKRELEQQQKEARKESVAE